MDEQITALVESLHEYERLVLPLLQDTSDPKQIVARSKLDDVRVSRAFQWLSNKNLIQLTYTKFDVVDLDTNGRLYKKDGFPEKKFLLTIADGKEYTLADIQKASNLSSQEVGVCMGILKQAQAITTSTTNKGLLITITIEGLRLREQASEFDDFLQLPFPLSKTELTKEQQAQLEVLQKRRQIVRIDKKQSLSVTLTDLGRQIAKMDLQTQQSINTLTHLMLMNNEWKGKSFRPYDMQARVPKITGGRIHPLTAVIRRVRQVFLDMGFVEMKGPWVETAFWCMDSMWIPQDHPARDVQDTFFLNKTGDLPDKELVKRVAKAHEDGADSGSKGYGYQWNPEVAKQLVLRTHTTATTYRTFGDGKIKAPARYFCIDRVFRNEALDATHLPEFHQVEGFVMAPDLTLADLLGLIKEFYARLGFTNIRFKPTYNPYTESSIEALYYDERRGAWMELINSGIFRPESLAPYGIKCSVLAWGMGVERLAMIMLEQNKLKDIVGPQSNLSWLSTYKAVK